MQLFPNGHSPPRQPQVAVQDQHQKGESGAQRQDRALAHPLHAHESRVENARRVGGLHRPAAGPGRQGHHQRGKSTFADQLGAESIRRVTELSQQVALPSAIARLQFNSAI